VSRAGGGASIASRRRCAARRAALAVPLLLIAGAAARAVPVSIGLSIPGSSYNLARFFPPDPVGAVGDTAIVEMVNGYFAVYRKSDGLRLTASRLDTFWFDAGVPTVDFAFDPRILYDPLVRRWYAVAADGVSQPNRLLFAVSLSSDPTQGFAGFAFDTDPNDQVWADFPMLGFDADGVYVAAPLFGIVGEDPPAGSWLAVLPKAGLLAATPSIAGATVFSPLPPGATGLLPHPVVDLDGTGLPARWLAAGLAYLGLVEAVEVTGTITAPALSAPALIPVTPYPTPPPARQPAPGPDLDTGPSDTRFSASAVQRDGSIWAVRTVALDGRAAVAWLRLDAASLAVLEEGVLADPSLDLFYPSIAVNDAGYLVVAMNASSETTDAGAWAAVGQTVQGATSFDPPFPLRPGLAAYELLDDAGRNRFGDYSAVVADPADPRSFWAFQEYASASASWSVAITQLLVPEPGRAAAPGAALAALAALARRRAHRHVR